MKLTNFRCYERGFVRWCFKSKLRAETGPFRLVSAMCGVRGKFRGDQPTFDMALMFCFPPLLRKQQTFPFSSFSFYRRKYFSISTRYRRKQILFPRKHDESSWRPRWSDTRKFPLHLKRKLPLCCLQSYIAHCASTKRNLIKRVNYRSEQQQTQKKNSHCFRTFKPTGVAWFSLRSVRWYAVWRKALSTWLSACCATDLERSRC